MTFPRHFIIHGQHYGTGQDHWRRVHEELQDPSPYALFCPHCVEIWAKMPVEGSKRNWMVYTVHCENHPGKSPYTIHGSVLLNWETELLKILPPEMVRREFEVHMKLWEKEHAVEN